MAEGYRRSVAFGQVFVQDIVAVVEEQRVDEEGSKVFQEEL
jgi:hypothetical protein